MPAAGYLVRRHRASLLCPRRCPQRARPPPSQRRPAGDRDPGEVGDARAISRSGSSRSRRRSRLGGWPRSSSWQALINPVTSWNELAVAGSTLLVLTFFQPLRRRVQRMVDPRATTPSETVAAFAAFEPTSGSLWLRLKLDRRPERHGGDIGASYPEAHQREQRHDLAMVVAS